MKVKFPKIFYTPYLFFSRMLSLATQPVFLSLAAMGNLLIIFAALAFYFAEKAVNPKISSFLDVLWWSVATATTVGYGDVSPVTTTGKWIGIFMMLFGATLFCSFTALFASALISGQLKDLQEGLEEVEKDERTLDDHLRQIELSLAQIKSVRQNKK